MAALPRHALRTVVLAPRASRTAELVGLLRESADLVVLQGLSGPSYPAALLNALRPDMVVLHIDRDPRPAQSVPDQASRAPHALVMCGPEAALAALAYEVGAVDFWLAGRERESLPRTVARVRARLHAAAEARIGRQSIEAGRHEEAGRRRRIALRSEGMMVLVDPETIRHVDSVGNYVRVVHATGPTIVRCTLEALAARLGDSFVRVHRSHVVPLHRVQALRTSRNAREVVMIDGTTIALGRRYAALVEQRLSQAVVSPVRMVEPMDAIGGSLEARLE